MSGFQTKTTSPATTAPDPYKHVKYSLGMVLGVDDFDQEFAYLSNRDQWLARDTIGYGTICGLQVKIETDERGRRVAVEPGVAINPRGQLIRVGSAQCAYLNDWLAAHRDEVLRQIGSPPTGSITLYVSLCYRECPTDPVPIPGEPCRDETEATVASRLQDDFELMLSFTAPDQAEENALRDFVQWLSQVGISEGATSISLDQFIEAIHEAAHMLASPLGSPVDYMYGSPPSTLKINSADVCEYLRTAFRIWVTELRGHWRGPSCSGSIPNENCVLLAQLNVPLIDGLVGGMTQDDVDEERRPYLIHLRMLQEWLFCGRGAPAPGDTVILETAFGQLHDAGASASYSRADHTHGTPVLPPIPTPGSTVTPETNFGQAADAGVSDDYSRTDHTHGTPPMPAIPAPGNVVVAETNFGQTSNAGTASDYSRTDHTHGTPTLPAIPAPGAIVTPETNFGQAANVGVSGDFSRTDHTHGTPALPAIPGPSDTVIPETSFGQSPVAGSSNRYSRADHTHGTPSAAPISGDFVEHPAGLPRYFIEAAGIVKADGSPPSTPYSPSYNGLTATALDQNLVLVYFDTYQMPSPDISQHQYIIKAMPVFDREVWGKYNILQPIVNFYGYKPPDGKDNGGLLLFVTNLGRPIPDGLFEVSFVIEVSRYGDLEKIDVNTATEEDFIKLPHIGLGLARRIIDARGINGFTDANDLLNVSGIGEETLRIIRPFITLTRLQ